MFAYSIGRGAINKAGVGIASLDTYNLDGSPLKVIIIPEEERVTRDLSLYSSNI